MENKMMSFKWFILCLVLPTITIGMDKKYKCPEECTCSIVDGRLQTFCLKGGMKSIPIAQIDENVKTLIIRGPKNNISFGPMFSSTPYLEIIKITDSNVPAIAMNAFWGLKNLKILDLSRNNITKIFDSNFRGQDNLLELDLSKNKIYQLTGSPFHHLKDLRRLNLADNSIPELTLKAFYLLSKLKYLDLSGNPLRDLPPNAFRDVPELKVLKCRNCQLKKINPQLYTYLNHLDELDLGRNEFEFLYKDEFQDLRKLTKLSLDGNRLPVVVDELFRMQKSLQYLDLSYNRLAKIPNAAFSSLTNLTYLDLSYNKLVRLEPQAVQHLTRLKTLNISGNIQMDLIEMRNTFELISHLTSLAVADMGILPMGLLVPFKGLRYLNISGNHLDTIQVINPCPSLEFLDLSRNQLKGINDDSALRIKDIRNVRLDNNPLICDSCHMGTLIDIVRNLQWDTYPICFLPKSLRGAEITDLDLKGLDTCLEFITDEEKDAASTSYNFLDKGGLNTLAILGGIIFVLIAIIVLAMAVCFSRHRARYYTQEEKRNGGEAGKCLEKNLESTGTETSTIETAINKNKEINFKFPIDDRVCTIDEIILPPPPPPPTKIPPTILPPSPTKSSPKLKEKQQHQNNKNQLQSLQTESIVMKSNLIQLSPTTIIATVPVGGTGSGVGGSSCSSLSTTNKDINNYCNKTLIPMQTTTLITTGGIQPTSSTTSTTITKPTITTNDSNNSSSNNNQDVDSKKD